MRRVWSAVAGVAVVAVTTLPAGPVVHAAAPAHALKVWRIERVDGKPRPLKVSVAITGTKPGSFFGDVTIKRVGSRFVPYRAHNHALGYGFMYETGRQSLMPSADVGEGPVDTTSPTCAELGIASCDMPSMLGLTSTMTPDGVGWIADKPLAYDLYAVVYDMTTKGAPKFDKKYPGWRAVPVTNVSVTVVTRQQAEATSVSDGYTTVEHFHRAAVRRGRGPSVVQAILPCFGTSGPGVGSAVLTNSAGLRVPMDCDHPLHVAAAARPTDWTLSGDVVGANQQSFPYSRLIAVNFPP